ncbi:RHS repeat-associated core domain-containing protein, partial [Pseudomarimonas arenosa]|uniref:RHS repeat-associated core domain-containing protein n=1 Tax=Pseudomarimonas arenosa TaxID=2774145 RepID=UPI001CDB88FE
FFRTVLAAMLAALAKSRRYKGKRRRRWNCASRLRFPGQYYDSESGLHYNYFRDYDPSTGRYVESDPVGLVGGMSTFGYVKGNPLTGTDPFGLFRFGPSCSSEQRAQIVQAMIDVLLDLAKQCAAGMIDGCQTCKGCKYYQEILRYFTETVVYQCRGTNQCGQSLTNGLTALNPSLTMVPNPKCGCLKATVFHEAMHNMGPEYAGAGQEAENRVDDVERSCFTCGK